MKIISQGSLPEDEVYVVTCMNCKTRFEFEREEGEYILGDQRNESMIKVACPLCKQIVYAYSNDKKVPPSAYDYYNK